jgi:hypothetical protein
VSHERTDRRSTSELLDELKETAAPAIAGLAADERADVDEIVAMLTGNLEKSPSTGGAPTVSTPIAWSAGARPVMASMSSSAATRSARPA